MAQTFPWLSIVAKQYEQYRFKKLRFEYITRTGTTTSGSVLLAPDYDASDATPGTEAQMTTYEECVEDAPWKDIACQLKPEAMHPMGPRKYVRTGAVSGDIKTYDVANFFLAVVEMTGATGVGKLWVDYDVEFFVPQTESSSGQTSVSFLVSNDGSQALPAATENVLTMGAIQTNGLGVTIPSPGNYLFPKGQYIVQAQFSVDDATAEAFAVNSTFRSNGVAFGEVAVGFTASTAGGGTIPVMMQGLFTSDGSNLLTLTSNPFVGAGAFSIVANSNSLLARVA